jgi:uncharacterized membrane protein YkvA (DUF1232 family)
MEKEITPQTQTPQKPKSKFAMIMSLVLMGIAILYDISPIDIVPDVIPVLGWSDDFLITGFAIWNLVKQIKSRSK